MPQAPHSSASHASYALERRLPRVQVLLSKQCFWDEVEQALWVDARQLQPQRGVVEIIGWDRMMLDSRPIPQYPEDWCVLQWSTFSQLADWKKQIPTWVAESCALFPKHQLTLLHYCGKYPQLLELLDHAPMLAWRLVSRGLDEADVVALLSGKRTHIAEQLGWPGQDETVKFLRNLRLRWVNAEIAEQVELCVLDQDRLQALQSLPRINSMALSLAARFPHLIGSVLHQSLAQLPCRPMQCQSMVVLLEDAYRLAESHLFPQSEVDKIGQCRYLSEVSDIYQAWLNTSVELALEDAEPSMPELSGRIQQASPFFKVVEFEDWVQLSILQQHAWLSDYPFEEAESTLLTAWYREDALWAALWKQEQGEWKIQRLRGLENQLGDAQAWSDCHLWQASQLIG